MAKKVIVIGAGIGGMAVANLCAKQGYDVTVYERQATLGGRAGYLHAKGFTFDTGPSWYLMPEVFERYFGLFNKKPTDYYSLTKLTPAYTVFFDYRAPITIVGDVARDAQTFEQIEPGSGKQLKSYVASAEQMYKTAMEKYLYHPTSLLVAMRNPKLLRDIPALATLLTRPLHKHVAKSFASLPLQQILEYPMVFLGASPFSAPSLYHLMSYLDFKQGVYYPKGGMYKVVDALARLGKELGVAYVRNASVDQIVTKKNRATGVVVNGKLHLADIVISGADLHATETKLLSPDAQTYPSTYWQKKIAGPSALLMYLGVAGSLPELSHHNLLFVESWRQNFEAIFTTKQWPKKASMYISRTSVTDRTAPTGSENVFVLVPLPAGVDEPEDLEKAADHYLRQFEQASGIRDLRERIIYKSFRSTRYFTDTFDSWQGSALGMSHVLKQSAFWRPNSRSKKVHNLYYVGASVQPGIGVPMCLISAENAFENIVHDIERSAA